MVNSFVVAFCMYFGAEDGCFKDFVEQALDLEADEVFWDSPKDSELTKWIKKKLVCFTMCL